jgi:hypothetical protein
MQQASHSAAMISQILFFVVAIAVCANAFPQSRELTDDLAAYMGQLKVWPPCVRILLLVFCTYPAESKITAESFSVLTISL